MENNDIVALLKEKNLTLGSCESYTGGAFANFITNIPGASAVYKGGLVTYVNEIKRKIGVKQETLETYSAVSPETVREMLINARKFLETDVTVAFSGNAGPEPSEGKEVGLVYIGFLYNDKLIVDRLHIAASREEVKELSVKYAVDKIGDLIK